MRNRVTIMRSYFKTRTNGQQSSVLSNIRVYNTKQIFNYNANIHANSEQQKRNAIN